MKNIINYMPNKKRAKELDDEPIGEHQNLVSDLSPFSNNALNKNESVDKSNSGISIDLEKIFGAKLSKIIVSKGISNINLLPDKLPDLMNLGFSFKVSKIIIKKYNIYKNNNYEN